MLREACEKIRGQEERHLVETSGWARELWLKALGLAAVLPPPEERKHAQNAIPAARPKHQRRGMLPRRAAARHQWGRT